MFPFGINSDRQPIVDEMETEHREAVNTAVVNSAAQRSSSRTENIQSHSALSSVTIPWTFVRSCTNTLVYTLLGGSSFVTLWFGFRSPGGMTIFQWHIVLSIIGYQILMPYAMICLQSDSWASALSHSHRRRAHWIMQLMGLILAFIGSVIMMAHKTVNFNSLHGKFALAALLFTIASVLNGVSSLYTRQLRRYISPRLSKLSHSFIGTTAFFLSSMCLIYGFLKHSFVQWASIEFANVLIAVTVTYTIVICWPPKYKVYKELYNLVKTRYYSYRGA